MDRTEPDEQTKSELIVLGKQLMAALDPVRILRPGLQVVLCYAIPHGPDGQLATAIGSTITDPRELVVVYAKAGAGLVEYANRSAK